MTLDSPQLSKLTPLQVATAGPYMQGVLMESIDSDYAQFLHELPFNPYSQYCYKDKETAKLIWHISVLTDEACTNIIDPLLKEKSFAIHGLKAEFDVLEKHVKTCTLKDLTDIIQDNNQEKVHIRFITPTAFKSKGKYVFMPNLRLVFQNLFMHFTQVYEGDKEIDEETIAYLEQHVAISSYNLRSQYFVHAMNENKKVPAFVGAITLSFKGPRTVAGLAHMLLQFGEYAGVGIKTSMGMGGMRCELRDKTAVSNK